MLSAKLVFIVFAAVIVSVQCADRLVGVVMPLSDDDIKESTEILKTSLAKLAERGGPNYKLSKVNKATKQVVSGILYKYDAEIIDGNKAVKPCNVEIWSQPWLKNGIQVTFECKGEDKLVKSYSA